MTPAFFLRVLDRQCLTRSTLGHIFDHFAERAFSHAAREAPWEALWL